MSAQVDEHTSLTAAVELALQTGLLQAILAQLRTEVMEVGVSDAITAEMVLDKHPVSGVKRILARRTGNGFDSLAVPTGGVLVLPPNEARLGSQWVNSGTFPVIIYLSDRLRPGVPAVWLAAGGGAWDGRIGSLPWCGNLFAVGQGGNSTLVGGEV
jgi:hypothetical protein